jgi:hypothetical protein
VPLRKFFLLFALSLMLGACQKSNDIVVDNSQKIINATQLVFTGSDSIDIANSINVHPPNLSIKDSFKVALSSVDGFSYLDVKVENDSGTVLTEQSFTSLKGDSVVGSFSFIPSSVYVGYLTYTFTPYNNSGASGNYETRQVRMYNSKDRAPVIDSVSAPDSLMVGSDTTKIILTAFVHDPSGVTNIATAYFNVTKPNGEPGSGNPNTMYDDGKASGLPGDVDPVAGDGQYTLGIALPPGTATGIYIFTFYAINRSGLESYPFIHKIKVY